MLETCQVLRGSTVLPHLRQLLVLVGARGGASSSETYAKQSDETVNVPRIDGIHQGWHGNKLVLSTSITWSLLA